MSDIDPLAIAIPTEKDGIDVPFDTEYSPKEKIKTIFEKVSDQVTEHIPPTTDETKAINIASQI